MSRSLAPKLTLAFLVVSLIGVALVALFVRQAIEKEFDRFLLDQRESDFVEFVTTYYQSNQSWIGVGEALRKAGLVPAPLLPPATQSGDQSVAPLPPAGQAENGQLPPIQPIVLAGPQGYVVIPGGPYRNGERVVRADIERGVSIEVDGRVVGTVIDTSKPVRDPAEERFLERSNRAALNAALVATGIALILGVVLARTLTRPLRELTAAIHQLSTGTLDQEVPVRTRDELGELTTAFNQMSAELNRSNELRRQMTADNAHD